MIMMYRCTKRMKKFSIANMMTSDWERFKKSTFDNFG